VSNTIPLLLEHTDRCVDPLYPAICSRDVSDLASKVAGEDVPATGWLNCRDSCGYLFNTSKSISTGRWSELRRIKLSGEMSRCHSHRMDVLPKQAESGASESLLPR